MELPDQFYHARRSIENEITEQFQQHLDKLKEDKTIIIGEKHANAAHKKFQEKAVDYINPEIIIHEAFTHNEPFNTRNTPKNFSELKTGIQDPSSLPSAQEIFKRGKQELDRETIRKENSKTLEIPENPENLRQIPFHRLELSFMTPIVNEAHANNIQYRDEDVSVQDYLERNADYICDRSHSSVEYLSQVGDGSVIAGSDLDDQAKHGIRPLDTIRTYNSRSEPDVPDKLSHFYCNLIRETEMSRAIDMYSSDRYETIAIVGRNHSNKLDQITESETSTVNPDLVSIDQKTAHLFEMNHGGNKIEKYRANPTT